MSLESAYDRGRVKVNCTLGDSYEFRNIELENNKYYGVGYKVRIHLDTALITDIYLQDIKKSDTQTLIFYASVIVVLALAFLLFALTFELNIWIRTSLLVAFIYQIS